MNPRIKQVIEESILIKRQLLASDTTIDLLAKITEVCTIALKADKKLLFCGNGGSAADAQHLAAEFSGRFYLDREPLHAEALHVNTSFLTAVANDYDFNQIYTRQVKAKGRPGDVLFVISTSGNSTNILEAVDQARKQHMITVGLTGATGGKLKGRCDFLLTVPSVDTPRIQEAHILLGHIICELVEKNIFE